MVDLCSLSRSFYLPTMNNQNDIMKISDRQETSKFIVKELNFCLTGIIIRPMGNIDGLNFGVNMYVEVR